MASNVESLVLALDIAHPDTAWKIVGLVACAARYDQVQTFANTVLEVASPIARAIAMLVGEPLRVVEECLTGSGDLMNSGLLQARKYQHKRATCKIVPARRISRPEEG